MIASSDLHVPRQMTSWKTVLSSERSQPAVLDAIRRQELSFTFYRDAPALAPNVFSAFSPLRNAILAPRQLGAATAFARS